MIPAKYLSKILPCLFFCAAITLSGCNVQKGTITQKIDDNPELKELVSVDQQMRQKDTGELEPTDKKHRARVMYLLANGLVRTNEDKLNAALILQHTALMSCNNEWKSISAENYFMAHQLAKSAFESGDKRAAYMTAVTYDRYLLYTEGYQKYGTQRVFDEATDQELWAPIDTLTTDEERKKFNVPPLTELLKKYKMKPFPNSKK